MDPGHEASIGMDTMTWKEVMGKRTVGEDCVHGDREPHPWGSVPELDRFASWWPTPMFGGHGSDLIGISPNEGGEPLEKESVASPTYLNTGPGG